MASLSQQIALPFTAIEVKALAACRAVEFAAKIGLTQIILERDSQVLIDTLNSGGKSLAQFGHLTNDVLFLPSQNFNAFKISHVCRQYNITHVLAQRAINSSDMLV